MNTGLWGYNGSTDIQKFPYLRWFKLQFSTLQWCESDTHSVKCSVGSDTLNTFLTYDIFILQWVYLFFKDFIYLFLEGKGERNRGEMSM